MTVVGLNPPVECGGDDSLAAVEMADRADRDAQRLQLPGARFKRCRNGLNRHGTTFLFRPERPIAPDR
jgi:hypothetical protein